MANTPVEEIRAAAALLREPVNATTPDSQLAYSGWIQVMSPALAQALAAWLESWEGVEVRLDGPMPEDYRYALRVARAINGGA
ncbi:hypothetical protein ABT340_41350 [Streptosporangium sp. NPDC000239]|uniref:hypothetical protein n=1 Tax=Streptosporangium sp. NPDC000239 TaxID=3154248 RepID=UPI00331A93EC